MNSWLYQSCANWLDKKHKHDHHALEDRAKLVEAARERGFTSQQVSETIHQVNEDRRIERERLKRDDDFNENAQTATPEPESQPPAQQQRVCTGTVKRTPPEPKPGYTPFGTKASGNSGMILRMAEEKRSH